MSDWEKLANDWSALTPVNDSTNFHACNCVGPQKGQPVCPCRMRGVSIENGRYVEVIDHGPARARSKV